MQYRFKQNEIDDMKSRIWAHCECETVTDKHGNKSAWRLRLRLETYIECCAGSRREKARGKRQLALYESLTHDDMPVFAR